MMLCYAILVGDGEAPRTNGLRLYVGTTLQIVGTVIVVIMAGLVVSHLKLHLRRRGLWPVTRCGETPGGRISYRSGFATYD